MFIFSVVLFVLAKSPEAKPTLHNGNSCPSGYVKSGNYCNPTSSAMFIVDRGGTGCPSHYRVSDSWCVATNSATHIFKSEGTCSSGYYKSDSWCVAAR